MQKATIGGAPAAGTAPGYPGPGPVNGGHLRKAWVSLPFLIYRASERHSDQVGKTTKVFRCVPHRNPENTGRVRISGYIGTCVPISEQKFISPLLHTLRDRGYLTLDDQDHHYRIGRMAFRIGNTYLDEASALRSR